MSLRATINLDGQDLMEFLREHKIRVRYVPGVDDKDGPILGLSDISTDTSKSPLSFISQVDSIVHELNREIAQLEGMGLLHYQQPVVGRIRVAIADLMALADVALLQASEETETHMPRWLIEVIIVYLVLAVALYVTKDAKASEACDRLAMAAYDCQFDRQHGKQCEWVPITATEVAMSREVWGQPQFFAEDKKQRRASEFAREWKAACINGYYE